MRNGVQVDLVDFVSDDPDSPGFVRRETFGPVRTTPTEDPVYRFTHCPEYGVCLLYAGRRRWGSFSCASCYRTAASRGNWVDAFTKQVTSSELKGSYRE